MHYLLSPDEFKAVIAEQYIIAKNVNAGTAGRNEAKKLMECCRKLEMHNVALNDLLKDKHTV